MFIKKIQLDFYKNFLDLTHAKVKMFRNIIKNHYTLYTVVLVGFASYALLL